MKLPRLDLMDVLFVKDVYSVHEETVSLLVKSFKNIDIEERIENLLEKIKSKKYEIIIINIESVDDVSSLINEIKEIDSEISIVIATQELDIVLVESLKLYVDGYILHKYSSKEIIEVLNKIANNILIKQEFNKYKNKFSEQIDKKISDLKYKTVHDQLTDTYNYYAFIDSVNSVEKANIILLNIDHFDAINEIYGFEIGDAVLIEVSRTLKLIKPANFQLFRLSGDEFAFIDEECIGKIKLQYILDSVVSFFNASEMQLDNDLGINVSFSIGITTGKGSKLLNEARIAIKEMRKHKRAAYCFFDSNSLSLKKQRDNVYWTHKIKEALSEQRLIPHFQPIINNKTQKIEKYECLARIEEDKVLIPPIRFMEAAKLTGMLCYITKAMIEQSCKKFANNDFDFSINITNDDLNMGYLKDFLLRHTKKNNIHPSRVILEILEDVASINEDKIIEQLHILREEGFKIAIDDFGSEYSNFYRLLDFHPDYLKIDGSFVKNIIKCQKCQIIIESIILLSHKSKIKVVAEYVHNEEVQNKIKSLGIDYSQGYYFSEPKAIL